MRPIVSVVLTCLAASCAASSMAEPGATGLGTVEPAATKSAAPSFYAVAQGNTLAIFSNSPVETRCTASVPFSYDNDKQERKEGSHICQNYLIPVGNDREVCRVTARELVAPKVEGPVTASCE